MKEEIAKPLPKPTSLTRPFWEAAARQQLVVQHCRDCAGYTWTPRAYCMECGSQQLEWTPVAGKGTVYSFTIIRQVAGRGSSKSFEKDIPYVVAWIDLNEGTNTVQVACGQGNQCNFNLDWVQLKEGKVTK